MSTTPFLVLFLHLQKGTIIREKCYENSVELGRKFNIKCNGTSPSGQLHSGDTNFGPRKNVHIIFVFVTSIDGTPLCTENELKVPYLCTLSHLEPLTVALFQLRITLTFEDSPSYCRDNHCQVSGAGPLYQAGSAHA